MIFDTDNPSGTRAQARQVMEAAAQYIRDLAAVEGYADDVARLNSAAAAADPKYAPPADGQPFVPPTGYQDAYPLGATVTYAGTTYKATQDGAWTQPDLPNSGWVEVAAEPGQPVAWQPRHAGEEDAPGALVTYQGHTWRNDSGKPNGHQPGTTGSGWTDLGPTT